MFDFDLDDLGLDLGGFKSHAEAFGEAPIDTKLDQKNQHLAALRAAAEGGLEAAKIPLADLLERGEGGADFDYTFWESRIKFRCSSLGALMTKAQGKSRAQRLAEAEEKLAKVEQEYIALREKDQSKYNEQLEACWVSVSLAKSPAMREKAEQKLNKLQAAGLEPSAAFRLKGGQLDRAKSELEQVKAEQDCTLSETAKASCKELFYAAFFGARRGLGGAALEHGIKYEQHCLERYNIVAGLDLVKNDLRQTELLQTPQGGAVLTGEADALWVDLDGKGQRIIREFKAPFDPVSYGKQAEEYKQNYFWQCQGYMLLYGADAVDLVASLTENDFMEGCEYSHLPAQALHTTFRIVRSEQHIAALLKKLGEAQQFTLNFGRAFVAEIGQTKAIPAPELD